MKAKIFTAILVLGFGITGVTATVQAAGASVASAEQTAHVHNWEESHSYTDYVEANSQYHFVNDVVVYYCEGCGAYSADSTQVGYEEHNMSGYSNGHVCCVDCGYEE